jgi:GPH family glycoside/pentoside/hexuronide:cation symporter
MTGKTRSNDNIRFIEYAMYGVGGSGLRMMFALTGSYLLMYMTNVAFLDVAVISVIIAVSRLLDGISDLIIGDIVDKTTSGMGKARVWLARMCLPYAVSMLLLFHVPPQFPELAKYVYVFLIYNLANTVFFTFLQVPQFAMVSLISADRKEQALTGNILSFSKSAGNMIGNALFVRLLMLFTSEPGNQNTQRAYTCSVAVFSLIMLVAVMVMVLTVRERVTDSGKYREKRRSLKETFETFGILFSEKYWIIIMFCGLLIDLSVALVFTGSPYYALYTLGDMGAMSWLVSAFAFPSLVILCITPAFITRISKRKIFMTGIAVTIVGAAGIFFATPSKPAVAGFLILFGIGGGINSSVFYGIVAETVTYTAHKTGRLLAGSGNALISAVSKLGQGLSGGLFGLSLSAAGFNAALDTQGIAQPESVFKMIPFMYAGVPCIGFAVVLLVFGLCFDLEKTLY